MFLHILGKRRGQNPFQDISSLRFWADVAPMSSNISPWGPRPTSENIIVPSTSWICVNSVLCSFSTDSNQLQAELLNITWFRTSSAPLLPAPNLSSGLQSLGSPLVSRKPVDPSHEIHFWKSSPNDTLWHFLTQSKLPNSEEVHRSWQSCLTNP